jgi:hypothetical protein
MVGKCFKNRNDKKNFTRYWRKSEGRRKNAQMNECRTRDVENKRGVKWFIAE